MLLVQYQRAAVRKMPQMPLDIEQRMFLQNLQKRQPQAKCRKIHTAEKRVADEFINNNGQIIFRASATPRIGHRQKQYARRIHRHISDDQRVASLNKVPFEYGHLGKATWYHKGLKLANVPGVLTKGQRQMSMNILHTQKPKEIRNKYLSGLYDAIMHGDRDGSDLGTRLVLSATFTGGPRYMYSHYLDALAICCVHGNPSFFITFTCNTNWPEIEEYMDAFPELTSADRADIVDRVFEKIKDVDHFLEIRTVNNTLYPTNKVVCEALGLLEGDQEWIEELQEAKESVTSPELRKLFVQILMFCEVSNPMSLWHMFWKDMSRVNLPFVIWNEQAKGFDMAAYANMPKPVVIAVSSTWATRKNGATPATYYYLNPNIPEATYILNVYAEFINPMDALEIQQQPYNEESQEQMRNRYFIETLLNVNPQHYKGAWFTTKETILEITAPNGWYYKKCTACNIKMPDDSSIENFQDHGPQPIANYSPEAHTFVPECNTIIASLNDQDMDTIPAALKETKNQTYIFQYHLGKKATVGYPSFTLDAVFKPNPQPLLTLPGPEQTTSPPSQSIIFPQVFQTMTPQDPSWYMDTGALLTWKTIQVCSLLLVIQAFRQFTRDNDVSVEFDAYGFSVKDYQTWWLLLRCDSTGDLYPVTQQPWSQTPVVLLSFSKHAKLPYYNSESSVDSRTCVLVPRPANVNVVRSMYKAHFVATRCSQHQGIDCDETFSLVVKLATIHTVSSLAVSRDWPTHQLDVKNALLHGHLFKTICMHQPPGFVDPNKPDYVCHLYRSLYGLKQAPRSDIAYLLLYVDDIILTASSLAFLQWIITFLHSEFATMDMGSLNYFLGISALRSSSGLFLCQSKLAEEILERAYMQKCNPCLTPVHTESKLGSNGDPVSDPTAVWLRILRYVRGIVAFSLQLYASSTAQLTAYTNANWAGCPRRVTLSRSSAEAEYHGVANVVAKTAWLQNLLLELHAPLTTSTIVYYDNVSVVYLSTNPVQHQHTKHIEIHIHFVRDYVASGQRRVTLSRSSAEAEYHGVANVVAKTAWLQNLLLELHAPLTTSTIVYYDNVSVVYLSTNPVQHQHTKHIEIHIHFVRDYVASGQVHVLHVPSRFQYADIFTKGLLSALFYDFCSNLNV
nr:hypothetical protein [Tanacetum cinerariifolium]